ncbi:MAG: Type 1 glutamine amidotransferase-like domain-containing protein, partial [Candidatus Saccharimonadales bacterium]
MRMYLSSYHLGNNPEKLKELVGREDARAAIILNAADNSDNERRASYVKLQVEELASLGINAEELDLRNYFDNNQEIAATLLNYDLVWVVGGNSFLLLRAMKQSGFDKVIVPLVENDTIVYAGFSAGAVVATPTLRGIELVDDKDTVPEGYSNEVVWTGLNLVGKSIAPHYKSNHPESEAVDEVVKYFLENGIDYWTLSD